MSLQFGMNRQTSQLHAATNMLYPSRMNFLRNTLNSQDI